MFGLNIPLAYKLDSKGLHKAKHEIAGFRETLKKGFELAGIGLGASEIFNIAKESVHAAQAEMISQRQLDMVLERSTKQHAKNSKSVEKYITAASRATGVVRQKLRPAFSILARTTNDTTKASGLLNKAMDISAATGKPLETVVRAVAKAYAGHDSTLRRLLPGIKDNQNAMAYATKTYKDARLTLADPFARLTAAVDVAKEALGKALLPMVQNVVSEITKPGGLADSMTKFFEDLSNPKTSTGTAFKNLRKQIGSTSDQFAQFFGTFDPKNTDPMVGFINTLTGAVKALPTILGITLFFKTVSVLGKFANGVGDFFAAVGDGLDRIMPWLIRLAPIAVTAAKFFSIAGQAMLSPGSTKLQTPEEANQARNQIAGANRLVQNTPNGFGANASRIIHNHITVNMTTNDPQKLVNQLQAWSNKNGSLPKSVISNRYDYPTR
jgi:hypothetical protein